MLRPRRDISQDPTVLELSPVVEAIVGTSGGPPRVFQVSGDELVAEAYRTGIYLGGPITPPHIAHELVHWHMLVPAWEALPQGAEEGLALLIGFYIYGFGMWYGEYTPADEAVLDWSTERWLAEATKEHYEQAARCLLAIGIPEVLARYGREVPPGFRRFLENYCPKAREHCIRIANCQGREGGGTPVARIRKELTEFRPRPGRRSRSKTQ